MAVASSTKLIALRRLLLTRTLKHISPVYSSSSSIPRSLLSPLRFLEPSNYSIPPLSRTFSSSGPSGIDPGASPVAVDYRHESFSEDEFHNLADSAIHHLLEKIEDYGDSVDIDGFDIDYGNQVLTVKFGNLGTYVLNKQTPNRQIWMSSPVSQPKFGSFAYSVTPVAFYVKLGIKATSGPSRFDWDQSAQAWVYRRTKEYLFNILESELAQLCGHAITLS
uniref:Ferroxidase n=1 Tax=Daucus carota subsp. sativus TaxID=79200 RepID=A0A162AHF7_DAUCS